MPGLSAVTSCFVAMPQIEILWRGSWRMKKPTSALPAHPTYISENTSLALGTGTHLCGACLAIFRCIGMVRSW